jgi:nitroimidazol reductase NimA-like FMN-containing flavoprotein (pyridoxamine 5'-phosphate oxidase superfamily)
MIEKMQSLLKDNSMCVLASSSDDRPHCSLMAYVADEEATTLFMVTLKTSRKYRNLTLNPHVSLLVDTRADARGDSGSILALTVSGASSVLKGGADKDLVLRRIVQAHPHLKDLAFDPDAEVISIKIESLLLLEGASTAHFEEL